MDAVGHVPDRHLVDRELRPQRLPHLARHLAVAAADSVGGAAHVERRLRHPEVLVGVLGMGATQRDHLVGVDPELGDEVADRLLHLLGGVGVVAGGHRRVGREHGPLARRREPDRQVLAGVQLLGGELDRRQHRVALVQVNHAGLEPERGQRPHAAGPEQHVLGHADVLVGLVQPRGDPLLHRAVLGEVGVEQEQRDAADVDAPDLGRYVRVVDRDLDRQRPVVGAGDERGRQPLRVGVDPVLVLPPAGVDPLAEVALSVHQPDRDHRDRAVGGLLEQVAGERAEAARVDRHRHVDPVLGAQERHRPGGVDRRVVRALEIGLDLGLDRGGPLEQARVGGGAAQGGCRCLLQEADRILVGEREPLGVDRLEQLRTAGQPGPAVVVGESRQRREGIRKALGEFLRCAPDVFAAVVHRHPAVAHGRGLSGKRYSRAS